MPVPASLHLSLILCCACLFCSPALAAPSVGELAEALHQKLLNSPESLQWRMPNEAEPVRQCRCRIVFTDLDAPHALRVRARRRFPRERALHLCGNQTSRCISFARIV